MSRLFRSNEFYLVSYVLDFDILENILTSKIKQIQSYAYILHDKDIHEEDVFDKKSGELIAEKGTSKEPHVHIYLKLFQSRNNDEIENWFKVEYNGNIQGCKSEKVRSIAGCLKYLTHDTKSSKSKATYSIKDVVTYNISLDDNDIPYDKTFDILNDYLSGTNLVEMVRKYGRDFLYHYTCYKTLRQDIDIENNNNCKGD